MIEDYECKSVKFQIYLVVSGEVLKNSAQRRYMIYLAALTTKRPQTFDHAGRNKGGFV